MSRSHLLIAFMFLFGFHWNIVSQSEHVGNESYKWTISRPCAFSSLHWNAMYDVFISSLWQIYLWNFNLSLSFNTDSFSRTLLTFGASSGSKATIHWIIILSHFQIFLLFHHLRRNNGSKYKELALSCKIE